MKRLDLGAVGFWFGLSLLAASLPVGVWGGLNWAGYVATIGVAALILREVLTKQPEMLASGHFVQGSEPKELRLANVGEAPARGLEAEAWFLPSWTPIRLGTDFPEGLQIMRPGAHRDYYARGASGEELALDRAECVVVGLSYRGPLGFSFLDIFRCDDFATGRRAGFQTTEHKQLWPWSKRTVRQYVKDWCGKCGLGGGPSEQ